MALLMYEHSLYQQMILQHNRSPQNYRELKGCTHCSEGLNPICGDHIWVYLRVEDSGDVKIIREATFTGESCAICKASASIMTLHMKDCELSLVKEKVASFQRLVQGAEKNASKEDFGKLLVFSTIWHYPARVKCATLAWHTMLGAVECRELVSTENDEHD